MIIFVPLAFVSWAVSGLVIAAAETVRELSIEYLSAWEARRNA